MDVFGRMSLPSREPGLKYITYVICRLNHLVAPFTGAWIEITVPTMRVFHRLSLPSRERGLKYSHPVVRRARIGVAPFTGAWIEIPMM